MIQVQQHGFIGEVIPAGLVNPRWMFVTKVEASGTIHGRMWSARKQQWTKGSTWYAPEAVYKRTPRCPQPRRPRD